jgi:uncharacterized protein (DUF1499 family)
MKTLLTWVLVTALLVAVLVVGAGQLGLFAGSRPTDLGVRDGRLKAPSRTPNSVSSQAGLHPGHPMQAYAAIEPLKMTADAKASIAALRALIEPMRGVRVVEQRDDYLRAEFATAVLGFVDDVEFWADAASGVIHLRSASRLGRKDFGVNRDRVERIRAAWVAHDRR